MLRGSKSEWKRKKVEERIDNSFERFNREGEGKNGPLRIRRGEFNKGQFLSTDGVHQSLSVHYQGCSSRQGEPEGGREERGPQKQQGPWEGGGALRAEGRTVVGVEGRETTQALVPLHPAGGK